MILLYLKIEFKIQINQFTIDCDGSKEEFKPVESLQYEGSALNFSKTNISKF